MYQMLTSTTQHHLHQTQNGQRSAFGIQQLLGLGSGGSPTRPSGATAAGHIPPQVAHLPPPPPPPPPASHATSGHVNGQTLLSSGHGHCFPGSESSRLAYLNSAALMSSMHSGNGNAAAAAAAAGVSMSMFHSFPGDAFTRNEVCSGRAALPATAPAPSPSRHKSSGRSMGVLPFL